MCNIAIKSVSKKYKNGSSTLTILDNCTYTFETGSFYSIVGRSGLGKTTLLSILGTIDKPDSGNVFIDEQNINNLSSNELAALRCNHIGFVFQNYCLIERYSVEDNLELALFFGGTRKKATIKKKIEETMSIVNLSENLLSQKSASLSGGEKQRVSIARALINNPSIIFADEPTGNLDVDNECSVIEIFRKLQKEMNKTIIMVTHSMSLAAQSDKIVTLQNGKIVAMEG